MKNLLTILFLFIVSINVYSQTVNGVPLDSIHTPYCEIVGTGKLFSNNLTIQLDFGQKNKFWSSKDTRVLDEKGKDIDLHSMVDALNFMTKFGYEFVSAYAVTVDSGFGKQNVYYYLMKRNRL